MIGGLGRWLRGAIGNAVIWGAGFGALSFGGMLIARTLGVLVPADIGVLDILGMSVRIGIMGGIAGGAFSTFIALAYRGRRLEDISALKFGLGAAVVTGLFVPAFMQAGNLISGELVPWHLITDDIIYSALFGGITGGGSMKLAQSARVLPRNEAPDALERGDA